MLMLLPYSCLLNSKAFLPPHGNAYADYTASSIRHFSVDTTKGWSIAQAQIKLATKHCQAANLGHYCFYWSPGDRCLLPRMAWPAHPELQLSSLHQCALWEDTIEWDCLGQLFAASWAFAVYLLLLSFATLSWLESHDMQMTRKGCSLPTVHVYGSQ